jgi:Fe-S cluster biogenesis protein NfuA
MLTPERIEELKISIEQILNNIKPFLKVDGGDVELVDINQDGIAWVKLLGSCDTCPLKPMTLRAGIERAIMHEFPEIRRIEEIN